MHLDCCQVCCSYRPTLLRFQRARAIDRNPDDPSLRTLVATHVEPAQILLFRQALSRPTERSS
jgi:hypothetical protein